MLCWVFNVRSSKYTSKRDNKETLNLVISLDGEKTSNQGQ